MAEIKVKGHWRLIGGKRKKKTPAPKKPAAGPHFVATSTTGQTCPHIHRTRSGARACANRLGKEARMRHARLTRKQAKATRVTRWDVDARGGA